MWARFIWVWFVGVVSRCGLWEWSLGVVCGVVSRCGLWAWSLGVGLWAWSLGVVCGRGL